MNCDSPDPKHQTPGCVPTNGQAPAGDGDVPAKQPHSIQTATPLTVADSLVTSYDVLWRDGLEADRNTLQVGEVHEKIPGRALETKFRWQGCDIKVLSTQTQGNPRYLQSARRDEEH